MNEIDKYVGWVEEIEGDLAKLMFKTSDGGEYFGQYSAKALSQCGINSGDHFECVVIEQPDGEVQLNFSRSEYQGPTPEERMQKYLELSKLLREAEEDDQ